MPSQDPPTSSLLFSPLATDFSRTLSALRKSTLSIHNHLRSIEADATFVQKAAQAYQRPLIANERCGSWYIPPESKDGSCYFKSTDGHMGQWGFSLRRLNLHLLELVVKGDGCLIVDSTRRGKRMPDALSKTIPLWCAVLNRVLFPEDLTSHGLHTPPQAVSESEASQIETRLEGFVERFRELDIDVAQLADKLKKPLRPLWITRESVLPDFKPTFEGFHPIILCTASKRVVGNEISEHGSSFEYIQGAGDDSEGWSQGLTPALYWTHQRQLLNTSEDELSSLISELLLTTIPPPTSTSSSSNPSLTPIKPTSISIGDISVLSYLASHPQIYEILIICGGPRDLSIPVQQQQQQQQEQQQRILHLPWSTGKSGRRRSSLRNQLAQIEALFTSSSPSSPEKKIGIVCPTGTDDVAVGAALTLLCLYYDDTGARIVQGGTNRDSHAIDKTFIAKRLAWIVMSVPQANPRRDTLKGVNDYLMSGERRGSFE